MVGLPKYTPEQRQFIYRAAKLGGQPAHRVVELFNVRWKGGVKGRPLTVAGVQYVCSNKDHPDLQPLFAMQPAGPARQPKPQQMYLQPPQGYQQPQPSYQQQGWTSMAPTDQNPWTSSAFQPQIQVQPQDYPQYQHSNSNPTLTQQFPYQQQYIPSGPISQQASSSHSGMPPTRATPQTPYYSTQPGQSTAPQPYLSTQPQHTYPSPPSQQQQQQQATRQ